MSHLKIYNNIKYLFKFLIFFKFFNWSDLQVRNFKLLCQVMQKYLTGTLVSNFDICFASWNILYYFKGNIQVSPSI